MALDGFFLRAYTDHLQRRLEGLKIEKIYQLGQDLVIHFRGRTSFKLRLSADSAHPRLLITEEKIETPDSPPMFCMLMRKHLMGGIVVSVKQEDLERVITLTFNCRNDFGDRVEKRLIIEIMGKHSNIILAAEDDRVIDSIKRVNPLMSPRPIGPGQTYGPPPTTKVDVLNLSAEVFKENLLTAGNMAVQKAIYSIFSGISPVLAQSMLFSAALDGKQPVSLLEASDIANLYRALADHTNALLTQPKAYAYYGPGSTATGTGPDTYGPTPTPTDAQGNSAIAEFSCIPLHQLRAQGYKEVCFEDFDLLLEAVYKKSNDSNRLVQKSAHLVKLLNLTQDRLLSKIANLEKDLAEANKLDELKLFGELLTANLWAITKGMDQVTVQNYYNGEDITIPLDVTKGPNENAQRYYKRYNKAKTTLDEAQFYMDQAEGDYMYLEGVKTMLLHAELPEDVDAIKEELADQGFMKASTLRKQKKVKKAPPHQYRSSEGVLILVGRNNMQNDELTLKKSQREHIWLHTKDVPGSHVIIQATFPEIDDQTVVEAAAIAAYHSKARYSSQVAVDFTEVKFVKKPKGAKPGMVIYDDFKTIYVTPDEPTILSMKV